MCGDKPKYKVGNVIMAGLGYCKLIIEITTDDYILCAYDIDSRKITGIPFAMKQTRANAIYTVLVLKSA